ncbi:MAG TPA: glucose 1-dehydrogenase [Acidimicrobiia bacterium]|nr:glucose 1-dehydrogenase [Acidimicrobiia bacterium]
MEALTVQPGVAGSVRLEHAPEPAKSGLLVDTLLVGVCGTDAEIVAGEYGTAPPGRERLILGHECVGRVVDAPKSRTLEPGDLVVPMVRRPDPVPCPSCAVGEWDMCQNGLFTEHGIKQADGFARGRFEIEEDRLVPVAATLGDLAVLVEPASVVAKAWEQIERIGARASWSPSRVLITGAGPVGLLAALLARQREYEVAVLDRVTTGPKPGLVSDLGAKYHVGPVEEAIASPDIVVECTGVGSLVFECIAVSGPNAVVCLTGISTGGRTLDIDAASVNRRMVLENDVVVGSVNANRRHYEAAVAALAEADPAWLGRLITRRVPVTHWAEAFGKQTEDVKVVLDFGRRDG